MTPPATEEARLITGMSALTRARNVGAAALPVVGPLKTVLAVCVVNVNERAGVEVGLATAVVNSGARLPELNDVTVPPPPPPPGPINAQVLVPEQYLYCEEVKSHIVGCCVPEIAGVQLGNGSVEVRMRVTCPLVLPCCA